MPSRRGVVVATVLAAAATGLACCYTLYGKPAKKKHLEADPSLLKEQTIRNRQFWGDDGQEKLESSTVVVVGLGGVGSHCAVALARAGVGHLVLIDFDQVTLSSLNRHSCATRRDVGWPKTKVLEEHVKAINPGIKVTRHTELFTEESAESLIVPSAVDYVVDCIDNIPTKLQLILYCYENGIPLVCSGGAGGKSDPTRVRIDPLSEVTDDELARATRTRLKAILKHESDDHELLRTLMCCYSCERGGKGLLPLKEHQLLEEASDWRPLDNFRVRIVPVIGPIPAMFGQALAAHILCKLTGKADDNKHSTAEEAARDKITRKTYKTLYGLVRQYFPDHEFNLTFQDAVEIYVNKAKGRCCETGKPGGPSQLQIVPKVSKGTIEESFKDKNNLVVMEKSLARGHLRTLFLTP